jgi:arylsulfatase A-like enzyme
MNKFFNFILIFLFVISCKSTGVEEFKGKIAKSYKDSVEWWPEEKKPPKGAPNILLILLDDTGFAQLGSYGGLIETKNLDKLAEGGLRYNNFHTTALCSPSRGSIMAGRNPHKIGLGSHSLTAMGFPGYNAVTPESAKSVAKILKKEGYVNYAIGKWDHTPLMEVSQVGPFKSWPSGEGFDHFFGFMAADADNYRTLLFNDNEPTEPWLNKENFHLSEALADKAIDWITGHVSIKPDIPFFVFWAPGAMHSPHQAPIDFIKKYKGKFDMGWDKAREIILTNQKKLGIIPENTQLTQRIKDIPAWDSLNPQERKLYAKQMEVFAGMLDHVDNQIGRIIETLKRINQFDNTLIIVTSDNGASGEGGLAGTFNETYVLNGMQTPFDANMRHFDNWGDPSTYPHYHAGWAMAGNTPFRYFKQAVHRGGISDPLIMHWPAKITKKGEIRNQYHHIIDIAPTLLEASGIKMPKEIDGVEQMPMDGVPMNYSFNDGKVESTRKVQYSEMFGNRALYKDGWKAVTIHANRMPWDVNVTLPFDKDKWELYNMKEDFSESNNVAEKFPEKLEELKEEFDKQAWANNVYPLYDDMIQRLAKQQGRLFGNRKEFVYYTPGAVRIAEKSSPPVKDRSHSISFDLNYKGNEQGVIVACGGFTGGYSVFIKDGRLWYDYNFLDGQFYTMKTPIITKGPHKFEFQFEKTGMGSGKGSLWLDGKAVAKVNMPQTHISTFSLSETFDVGVDNGTQVSKKYKGHFPFTGKIDKVTFKLLGDQEIKETDIRAIHAE